MKKFEEMYCGFKSQLIKGPNIFITVYVFLLVSQRGGWFIDCVSANM